MLLRRWKPATAHNRYRGLHAFYRWLEEEDDLPSPMAKMKPPAVPDQPVPVLTEPQLRALFAVCAGKDFEARRDAALVMVLLDAGPRRAELLGTWSRTPSSASPTPASPSRTCGLRSPSGSSKTGSGATATPPT